MNELLDAIGLVAPQLAATGAECDRDGTDPEANLALLHASGVNRLLVPRPFGGALGDGGFFDGWATLVRAAVEVSAGDGPTGQIWLITAMVVREIVDSDLPEDTKAAVAQRILDGETRLVASNSEAGSPQPVTARRVPGGLVLNGTKTFNSGSGGPGLAKVGAKLADSGDTGRCLALVELDDPNVELHHDWDVMGQRGTYSQTITYHDVFVADGWHYVGGPPSPMRLAAATILTTAINQGIGQGALRAAVDHLSGLDRPTMAQFADATSDLLLLRRVGEISAHLAAARALLLAAAEALEDPAARQRRPAELTVDGYRAKVAVVAASLRAGQEVYELTGARSLSNRYRLDRFWRNARAFASHDPVDAKNVYIGTYEVTGELPTHQWF